MDEHGVIRRICLHCGSSEARKLGECTVCHKVVCDHCGNTQMAMGKRLVTHQDCLSKARDGFKMIRFVK